MLVSLSIRLYEIHSSSRVSATPSRFSIFLMRLRPSESTVRQSMPLNELIFSMLLEDSARCLHTPRRTQNVLRRQES
jgi:hypothetical protein